MANFNFSEIITDVIDYESVKINRYQPVDATVFVQDILLEGYPFEVNFDINNNPSNLKNLSDELPIPFDPLVFTTIRGWVWGPRNPYREKIYPRGGGYIPVELTNYFDVPK